MKMKKKFHIEISREIRPGIVFSISTDDKEKVERMMVHLDFFEDTFLLAESPRARKLREA